MSAGDLSALDRVVRRVRLRMLWKSRLGWMARCMGPACAGAVVLSLILLWFGRPSVTASGAVLAIGLMVGIAVAARVQISAQMAATWVDERLGLADLLATALAVRGRERVDAAWAKSVIALAEMRAGRISAGEVAIVIGSGSVWGAVGASAALALTLGLISPKQSETSSVGMNRNDASSIAAESPAAVERSRPGGDGAMDKANRRGGAGSSPAETGEKENVKGLPGDDSAITGGAGSAGGGLAVSSAVQGTPQGIAPAHSGSDDGKGKVAGGAAGAPGVGSAGVSGGESYAVRRVANAGPWRASDGGEKQGERAIGNQAGAADSSYQDLMRDYFQRP